jgi:hypothetical protein
MSDNNNELEEEMFYSFIDNNKVNLDMNKDINNDIIINDITKESSHIEETITTNEEECEETEEERIKREEEEDALERERFEREMEEDDEDDVGDFNESKNINKESPSMNDNEKLNIQIGDVNELDRVKIFEKDIIINNEKDNKEINLIEGEEYFLSLRSKRKKSDKLLIATKKISLLSPINNANNNNNNDIDMDNNGINVNVIDINDNDTITSKDYKDGFVDDSISKEPISKIIEAIESIGDIDNNIDNNIDCDIDIKPDIKSIATTTDIDKDIDKKYEAVNKKEVSNEEEENNNNEVNKQNEYENEIIKEEENKKVIKEAINEGGSVNTCSNNLYADDLNCPSGVNNSNSTNTSTTSTNGITGTNTIANAGTSTNTTSTIRRSSVADKIAAFKSTNNKPLLPPQDV